MASPTGRGGIAEQRRTAIRWAGRHVEGPAELKIPKSPEENPGTDIPADILKIFADAKHTSHLDGIEQDAYTVEVSGSQNHNNFIGE